MRTRRGLAILVAGAIATAGTGCSSATAEPPGEITVFAASSLTEPFEVMADEFEELHPEYRVVFNFAGSQTLATQILEGASADVLATADPHQMERVVDASLAVRSRTFISNRMVIAVEADNPLGIDGLEDLSRPDLIVVLGAEAVPAGRYAQEVLTRAGVEVEAASQEQDVRAVISKVALGEADAGIVYHSGVVAFDGGVDAVEIPPRFNVVAEYPIAITTTGSGSPGSGAQSFVDFVLSRSGQEILIEQGFTQ